MKKVVLSTLLILLSIAPINAQKKELAAEKKLVVKMKDGVNPDVYVDGKKFDFPIYILDENRIESISVIKGEEALRKYNAPNGAVLIKIKKEVKKNVVKANFQPMIIIDGKKSNQKALKKLSPDDIDNITVLKGENALKQYNAADGVIIITTKKATQKH